MEGKNKKIREVNSSSDSGPGPKKLILIVSSV